ncbi:WXG100 family type VII secretion target [Thermomonospora cellulosilytica]|uniref:Uncharacterized protein YukE n=1 Tax=Thermomonospora cellulosilytica TaxID=1411118 RepID=A0A7W3MWI4_9ACTN|nr:hypothetical protein [Thermomonospora cellulosilytica]MBA9003176.1 uncharacterized protein YukE [Thermomonospora cellulosilytica]
MVEDRNIRTEIQGDSVVTGILGSFKVWENQANDLKKMVDAMKPGLIQHHGNQYHTISKDFKDTVELLKAHGNSLGKKWGGDAARQALEQMNKAFRQAQEIQIKSDQVGRALNNHALKQKEWQDRYGTGSWADKLVRDARGWVDTVMAINPVSGPMVISNWLHSNWGAVAGLQDINNGTKDSNDQFPPSIRADLPITNPNQYDMPPNTPPPPNIGGGPGGGMPGGPGGGMPGGPGTGDLPKGPGSPNLPDGPGGPNGPGGSDLPKGPNYPGGPGGSNYPGSGGSDLAGLGTPGGGGGGLGGGGGGLPGGPSGLGGGAGGVPGGPGGLASGPGGLPGAAPGMMGRGGPGAGGLAGAGRGGFGGMGMPMGAGGHGGGKGEERERSTWLTEDEDVWTGDQEAGPSVIG